MTNNDQYENKEDGVVHIRPNDDCGQQICKIQIICCNNKQNYTACVNGTDIYCT